MIRGHNMRVDAAVSTRAGVLYDVLLRLAGPLGTMAELPVLGQPPNANYQELVVGDQEP
jgi:hypothetical protein